MPVEYTFDSSALHPTGPTPAAIEKFNGTTVRRMVAGFNFNLNERGSSRILLPTDLDPSGTVTLGVHYMLSGPSGGTNVQFRFSHAAVAEGENYDLAYSNKDSGNKDATGTFGHNKFTTWTETVANLGWSAGDIVYFRVQRIAATINDNLSRLEIVVFRITIPT
jgi:hypothetical protein